MLNFNKFRDAVSAQYTLMAEHQLFVANIDSQVIYEQYLLGFKPGTNPKFRERTEHDCNCCKQFIRDLGPVLAIIDGKLVSVWDITLEDDYQAVADNLSKEVKRTGIKDIFLHYQEDIGTSYSDTVDESTNQPIRFEHFHQKISRSLVSDNIASIRSDTRSNKTVLERSLNDITMDAINMVLDLSTPQGIYKGEEYADYVRLLKRTKTAYDKVPPEDRDLFLWSTSMDLKGSSRFRSGVIGTLLIDISEDMPLDKAVARFEDKVAPHNFKRSKAIQTPAQTKKAYEKVVELGLESALHRRPAVVEDVTINNVEWADNSARESMGVFDLLATTTKSVPAIKDEKVLEIGINDFMSKMLPLATSIEMMVENTHANNLMTLIAPVHEDVGKLFKWDNNFSWTYNGEVTDSLRTQVQELGGRVDGVLRFTHTWNYDGKNQSLMDLHVFMPGSTVTASRVVEKHDKYGNGQRVGWNHRTHPVSGGNQDVDYTSAPGTSVPVENITFPDRSRMPDGKYVFKIHNWKSRNPNKSGFKAEIEFGSKIYEYQYDKPVENKEWITLAEVTLKNGVFSIEHFLEPTTSSKEIWGIPTHTFQKVSLIMNSPNHWDGEKTGNKHWFFILDNCANPNDSRGFYTEFLRDELHEHRRSFEMLGEKLRAPASENQLSGLGFSSTQRNHVFCKVDGRPIKINF